MNFERGDRVMISDAVWSQQTNGSRRVGRRGGSVVGISVVYGEPTVRVKWDGTKLPVHESPDYLMPYDPAKYEPPPKETRDKAKSAYMNSERAKMRGRLKKMKAENALTEEMARKINRALDAVERGDFD